MADVPFYLQGSQTAGLFQQPAGTQANTTYVPGQGMAPMASTGASFIPSIYGGQQPPAGFNPNTPYFGGYGTQGHTDALNAAIKAAQPYGQSAVQKAVDAFNSGQQYNPATGQSTPMNQGSGTPIWDEFHAMNAAASGGAGAAGTGTAGPKTGTSPGLFNGSGASQLSAGTGGISGFPTIAAGGGPANFLPGGQLPDMGITNFLPGSGQAGSQASGQVVPMTQPSAQSGLSQYYNTPGYQLTNSPLAVSQFQAGPGYQFAVDQALGQVQRNAASRGLLDSGAGLRAMTDRAQGMANQEFNNWQQNQQNQFNQYQNRLAGLASGPTGSEMAYGMGQGMGANAMQTGSNIGSLLANQGNSLFGGIVGAGGAQSQNVSQAGNMQAQILAGNLQTQMMLAALAGGQRR